MSRDMICGGMTGSRPMDYEAREVADKIRSEVESRAGQKFAVWQPLHHTTQVVAGTNYFIKIKVSDEGRCVHARVWQKLDQTLELTEVQLDKKLDDKIEYF